MTTKPLPTQPAARRLPPLPDPPRKVDMQENTFFDTLAEVNTLGRHLGAYPHRIDADILASGRGYLCRHRGDLRQPGQTVQPDLIVAYGVDPAAIVANNGYVIGEVGKSPELALEVASSTTGKNDYLGKRAIYAGLGVSEYWRFDHTGGDYHDAPLAGDRLTAEGVYRPIELHTEPDGVIWGYSEVLKLSLCWVPGIAPSGRLRFWDPADGGYLLDPAEGHNARLAEREARLAAQDQADAERDARLAAETRADAAETRVDAAETRADAAETRADAAETRADAAETRADAAETRADTAESQADAESEARLAAETRARHLEAELRRLQNP